VLIRWLKKIGAFLAVMSLIFFVGGGADDEPTGLAILAIAAVAAMSVGNDGKRREFGRFVLSGCWIAPLGLLPIALICLLSGRPHAILAAVAFESLGVLIGIWYYMHPNEFRGQAGVASPPGDAAARGGGSSLPP
jgi:drug/metabolite transporter (DMT)-like permease